MAFLPNSQCDVFVSYATANNEDGWVTKLRGELQKRLDEALGRRDAAHIWMDSQLRGNEPFDDQLTEQVTGAGILLVVLSRAYLQSRWCQKELELFTESVARDGGVDDRIFLLHYEPTDPNEWPHPFQGLSAVKYRFYEQEDRYSAAIPVEVTSRTPCLFELREELADKLKSAAAGDGGVRRLSTTPIVGKAEMKTRTRYLRELRKDIEAKLTASIHQARRSCPLYEIGAA